MQENPFTSVAALSNSSIHYARKGSLVAAPGVAPAAGGFLTEAHETFRAMIDAAGFPCVGAKAALNGDTYDFAVYDELAAPESTAGLCRDLCAFAQSQSTQTSEYSTFVAVFRQPLDLDEAAFEQALWRQLRALNDAQATHFAWDSDVSADPADPHFSFSFAGRAFYVLGIHGGASRDARRFPWPALVFNPHEQFERLRTDGKWKRMQQTIRARDTELQGSINPMLNDFGQQSEARQYSGRAVETDWCPPFPAAPEPVPQPRAGRCPFAH
jgi:FPC/CPF motif-containing protein YcgG